MATDALPSLIIVHGAWHQSLHYSTFTSALKSAGFPSITTPQLPSASSSPPEDAFAQDVAVIRKAIESEASSKQDVVLLAHSYGGCVATEALNDLPTPVQDRISGIVFLAAVIPEAGESLATAMKTGIASYVQFAPPICTAADPAAVFYNSCADGAAVQAAVEMVVPHAMSAFIGEVGAAGWRDYPVGFVKCMRDYGLTLEDQGYGVEKLRARKGVGQVQVVEVESDHCPTISMPEKLVEVVRGMVEGFARRKRGVAM